MKKILTSLVLALASTTFASLDLVKDGKPLSEIVCPQNAASPVVYAAEELRDHVKMITGAELPIVTAAAEGRNAVVLSVADSQFAQDLKAIGATDGYAIRQKGSQVFVVGAIPKGVLNGVYKLLFNNTDIIWARPDTEIGTIYTESKDLTLSKTDWVDVPKYILRGWQFPSPRAGGLPSDIWQFRQGSNWSASHMAVAPNSEKYGCIKEFGGGHNLCGVYISEGKYYKTHPEFYSLVKGKRSRHSELRGGTQLCLSNAEMTKCFVAEVDSRCKQNTQYDTYRIMIEDNYHVCECENCTKPITLADGTVIDKDHPAYRSTQFFLWLNPIARHIWDNYHKRVLTFAYFFTEIPPLCPVEPNISISLCPIYKNSRFNILHPENKVSFDKADGWLKCTPHVTWREYYGLCAAFPRPIDAVAIDDYRYMNSRGVVRTYSEMRGDCGDTPFRGRQSWDVNSMYFWVIANATWNPEPDVLEFRHTFLDRVYKQAASDVERFYAIIEKDFIAAKGKSGWNDDPFANYRNTIIAKRHVNDCLDALAAAKAKGLTGKRLMMLEKLTHTFQTAINESDSRNAFPVMATKKPLPDTAEGFDSKDWNASADIVEFVTSDNLPAKSRTLVRTLYDNANIYFGIRAFAENTDALDFNRNADGKLASGGESFSMMFFDGNHPLSTHVFTFDPTGNATKAMKACTVKTQLLQDGWFAFATIPWKSFHGKNDFGFRCVLSRTSKTKDAPAVVSKVGSETRLPIRFYAASNIHRHMHFSSSILGTMAYAPARFDAPNGDRKTFCYPPLRWRSEILVWGDKDEKISFKLQYNKVNGSKEACQSNTDALRLEGPNGETVELGEFVFDGETMKGDEVKSFTATLPATGLYRLKLNPGFNAYIFLPSKELRWALRGADDWANSTLVRPNPKPVKGCFQVPKGVRQFCLDIAGGAGANTDPGTLILKNAKGETVRTARFFDCLQTITVNRDNDDDEIWTFEAVNPRYAFQLRLPSPLTNIWANSPGNLPRLAR